MQEKFESICGRAYWPQLTEGLAELQAGRYLEAHERFEDLFRVTCGEQRLLFHALAQLCASHHQLTLGRARAAVRTWHKARAKLASLGLLSARFADAMSAFHAQLGIDEEQPRFLDPARLGAQSFPSFEADTLHTPST